MRAKEPPAHRAKVPAWAEGSPGAGAATVKTKLQGWEALAPDGTLLLLPQDATTVDPSERVRPWERLPREVDAHWAWFRAYLQSGYPEGPGGRYQARNLAALAEALHFPKLELAALARSLDWVTRAGAWDRVVERRKAVVHLSEVDSQREAHGRIARKMRNLAEMELDKMLTRAMDPTVPVMSSKEVMVMVDLTVRLERLFSGETQALERQISGGAMEADLRVLCLEDLEKLYEITQKAAAK